MVENKPYTLADIKALHKDEYYALGLDKLYLKTEVSTLGDIKQRDEEMYHKLGLDKLYIKEPVSSENPITYHPKKPTQDDIIRRKSSTERGFLRGFLLIYASITFSFLYIDIFLNALNNLQVFVENNNSSLVLVKAMLSTIGYGSVILALIVTTIIGVVIVVRTCFASISGYFHIKKQKKKC